MVEKLVRGLCEPVGSDCIRRHVIGGVQELGDGEECEQKKEPEYCVERPEVSRKLR